MRRSRQEGPPTPPTEGGPPPPETGTALEHTVVGNWDASLGGAIAPVNRRYMNSRIG